MKTLLRKCGVVFKRLLSLGGAPSINYEQDLVKRIKDLFPYYDIEFGDGFVIEGTSAKTAYRVGDQMINHLHDKRIVILKDVIEHVDFNNKDILEIGCGNGHFHPLLHKEKFNSCFSVDQILTQVECTRLVDLLLKDSRFKVGRLDVERGALRKDIRKLCKKDTFDIVLCTGVIYHLTGPLRLLLQLPLLLSLEGILVIETNVIVSLPEYDMSVLYLQDKFDPVSSIFTFSPDLLITFFKAHGFNILFVKHYKTYSYEQVPKHQAERMLVVCQKKSQSIPGYRIIENGDWIEQAYLKRLPDD
ncbi:DUF1698 domain-containing protein [Candidatus Omnitrophota bacterium]